MLISTLIIDPSSSQDHKLKHMADLQSSVVTDSDNRHQIQAQILSWEENLERLYCERFRLKCYMASLQAGELPNPKVSEPSHYVSASFMRLSSSRISSLFQ